MAEQIRTASGKLAFLRVHRLGSGFGCCAFDELEMPKAKTNERRPQMKLWISSLTLTLLLAQLCFGGQSKNTVRLDQQVSEAELTEKFNAALDEELSADNVCLTPSAARTLNSLMAASAAKIVRREEFVRVPEAEENIRRLAKALLAAGIKEAGRIRITTDTIDGLVKLRSTKKRGGGGGGGLAGLLCPLFPIC